jgi:hypothetical protein
MPRFSPWPEWSKSCSSSLNAKSAVTLKSTDDQGRPFFGEPYPWSETEHSFALEVPLGAKALKATFAIHPSRLIEFVARPRQESPKNTSSTE